MRSMVHPLVASSSIIAMSLLLGCVTPQPRTDATQPSKETLSPRSTTRFNGTATLDIVRRAAREVVTEDWPEEPIYEAQVLETAPCTSPAKLKSLALLILAENGFQTVGIDRKFPRQILWFGKFLHLQPDKESDGDVLPTLGGALYFLETAADESNCHVYFGAFAALSHMPQGPWNLSAIADREMGLLMSSLGRSAQASGINCLQRFAEEPASTLTVASRQLREWIPRHVTTDTMWSRAANAVRQRLPDLLSEHYSNPPQVDLFVIAYPNVEPAPPWFTRSCSLFVQGFERPTILCNEDLLQEVETVVRSTEEGGDILSSDAGMHRLVNIVHEAPPGYLSDLRASDDARLAEHIAQHLEIALLFFTSHELGHLLQCQAGRQFILPSTEIADISSFKRAVTKLCRHADEFLINGFRLDYMDQLLARGNEAQSLVEELELEDPQENALVREQYSSERLADDHAVDMMLRYLEKLDTMDMGRAREEEHVLLETLFVWSLYTWYRDLAHFQEEHCRELTNSIQLSLCLGMGEDKYVASSELFGDVHGFVLLRSLTLLRAVVAERTDYMRGPDSSKTLWPDPEALNSMPPEELRRTIQRTANLQRYELLRMLVDTPLKFAFTGCMSAWVSGQRDTPLAMIYNFYPLEVEIERLRELP